MALTRARVESLLDQVTTRPLSGAPLASFGVAVSCTVWPTGTLADGGLTVTEATRSGEVGDGERSQLDASVPAMTNVAAATDRYFDGKGIHGQRIEADARESVTGINGWRAK